MAFEYADKGWVAREIPEDAGVIQESRGTFAAVLSGRFIGAYEDQDRAEEALEAEMEAEGFYPDCFYVNERGNVEQLIPVAS